MPCTLSRETAEKAVHFQPCSLHGYWQKYGGSGGILRTAANGIISTVSFGKGQEETACCALKTRTSSPWTTSHSTTIAFGCCRPTKPPICTHQSEKFVLNPSRSWALISLPLALAYNISMKPQLKFQEVWNSGFQSPLQSWPREQMFRSW